MAKNLLIVESPTKARTVKKYLGPDFEIKASVGHVKDLPKTRLGVDIENNFKPEYVTIKGKGKVLQELRRAGKKADVIYLGPDPDREGEAIAWHIAEELNPGDKKIYRVLFHELTPKGIKEAMSSPQALDRRRYESQQARRILDRLVGYQISPLLWNKVRRGLSAGRVQSVALKMICDREKEIYAFEPKEYWSVTAHLKADEPPVFKAKLWRYDGRKVELGNQSQTESLCQEVKEETFRVTKITKRKKKRNPPPPFITSLLQQEAYKRLGFSAKRTMAIAQGLYEGVELGPKGHVGLITYMRTDSFRLSDDAIREAREYLAARFGKEYLPQIPNRYKSPKGAQEAHEAIRPTSVALSPDEIGQYLTKDQLALYTLIWKRFLASQMAPLIYEQTVAEIQASRALFRASGSIILFKGFSVIYGQEEGTEGEGDKKEEAILPPLRKNQALTLLNLEPTQHFTQPPPRYTEATLIKALEENGIGRPSTYATILSNITERDYVKVEKGRFRPTELGFLVGGLLEKSFPEIMDVKFTAQMETELDKVEKGQVNWTKVLEKFYSSFQQALAKAEQEMRGEVPTEVKCVKCGRHMVIRSGRNGLFLACSGYPDCSHTANFVRDDKGRVVIEPGVTETDETCELCGKKMVIRNGKFGRFIACSGYPECKNTRGIDEVGNGEKGINIKCRECGSPMVVKRNKAGQQFLACSDYPTCRHTEPMTTGVRCPEEGCEGTLVERKSKKGRSFYACNRYPSCRFLMWEEPYEESCPVCGTRVLRIKRTPNGTVQLLCRNKRCNFSRPLGQSGDKVDTLTTDRSESEGKVVLEGS